MFQSFLLDRKYNWKFASAYDLTFSYGPGGEHSTTYLGEGKNPNEKHLLDLAKKHNIKNAQKIIDEVKSSVANFSKYAKEYNVGKQTSILIARELNRY